MKKIEKSFPANNKLDIKTFLNDPKVDAELYAFLMTLSKGSDGQTIVLIKDIPSYAKIGQLLAADPASPTTRQTISSHFKYLVSKDYLKLTEDKTGYYILNPDKLYFNIPLDTLRYLLDTVKELVIKIYIYLGICNNVSPNNYVFTIKELCEHLNINYSHTASRDRIRNCLDLLKKLGLVNYTINQDDSRHAYFKLTKFTTKCPIDQKR